MGFCENASYESVIRQSTIDPSSVLAEHTVCDYYNFCREVVASHLTTLQTESGKIGGPGVVVQIDESKFGRQKYHRGRHIRGHWVLGMVADGSDDLRFVVCPEGRRDADTLVPMIQDHVAEGSIIRTDYWRAYLELPSHGFVHQRVNHSDPDHPFVSSDGVHTNRIESMWSGAKTWFRTRPNRPADEDQFSLFLCEYLWRRLVRKQGRDPMLALLDAIREEYGDFRR